MIALSLTLTFPLESLAQEDPLRAVVSATAGRWAALGLRNGDVVVYDVLGGKRYQWAAPSAPVSALAVDPMGISAVHALPQPDEGAGAPVPDVPPVVLAAAPGPGAGYTTLYALRGDNGILLTEMRLPGTPAFILVEPGQGRVYLITGRPAGEGRPGGSRSGIWTLKSVDMSEAGVEGSVTLAGPIHAAAISPAGDRIYVGLDDSIRSFSTRPLRSSWMLRSPGRNRLVQPVGSAGAILVARDGQLAILNPDNLPRRDPSTGSVPTDDAVLVLDLPFIGRHLAVKDETGEALVLDARGARMVTVDLEMGRVIETKKVPEAAAALFHPRRDSILFFEIHAERVFEMLHTPPDRAALAPAGEPPPAAGSPAPPDPEPAAAIPPAGAGPDPAAGSAEPGPAPGEAVPDPDPPAGSVPGPPEDLLEEDPPPPESLPAGPLNGRITGEASLVEAVVFYGPDAVLKEHARIRPAADGSFTLPPPPPGRYRVLVLGLAGSQLRCSPPIRHIVVGREPVPALEFRVAGRIRGSLQTN
jgi:hypothetical protein